MREELPELVRTFFNYIWVNLPKDWSVDHKYEKYFLYVNVVTRDTATNRPVSVRKKYSADLLKKFKDNLEEVGKQAARDISDLMKKKLE